MGMATARLFIEQVPKVLLVDTNESPLQKIVKSFGESNVSYRVADITNPKEVKEFVWAVVERYGGINIFVNHASIEGDISPIVDYPLETFDKVIAVNVRGAWLGLKYVIPLMAKSGGGSIILMSSVAGIKDAKRFGLCGQ